MKEYAIGYLAQRTGLAVSAIRHYESQGLIKPNRTTSGQRRFARSDIRRLSFIKIAQNLGFSLPYIRDLLASLPDHRTPSAADWARISKNFESVLNTRIKRLEQLHWLWVSVVKKLRFVQSRRPRRTVRHRSDVSS
jgi:MerR family redox-sensitive transcriptional activator SoxR